MFEVLIIIIVFGFGIGIKDMLTSLHKGITYDANGIYIVNIAPNKNNSPVPTPWKCSAPDGTNMVASRVNANHMVDCISDDNKSCIWTPNLAECQTTIANVDKQGIYSEIYSRSDIGLDDNNWHFNTLQLGGIKNY